MQIRIVCAANINTTTGDILLGVRHWDEMMQQHRKLLLYDDKNSDWQQGFITSKRIFVSREEAYEIAEAANQIVRDCGNPGDRILYSEHLY